MSASSRRSKASSSSDWKIVAWSSAPSAWRVFVMLSRRRRKKPRRCSGASSGGGGASSPVTNSSCQVRATAAEDRTELRGALLGRGAGADLVLRLLLAGELAGDDPRHAVTAHAHAVERVGGVHRPLLVGDDDELGAVGVAAD